MQLLEREHPLQVLLDRAGRAFSGEGSVVLVAGEAGIGKTVLLRSFVQQVRGGPTLWGMCDALSTPRPLGALRDVAGDLGPSVSAPLDGGAAQHEIFAAVLDAVRDRGRVLIVEDLHWADEATLDLVRFLARRVDQLPLLLVLSYRDGRGPDHSLTPVLGDLVSLSNARRLQLAPLSRGAVARLLDGVDVDADDVYRRTAGNPFFVSQIAAQPESALPQSVREAVLARTAGLPRPVRRCLELLSCAPEPLSPQLLTALEMPAAAVERLATTGLVDHQEQGLMFRHEIARLAVQEAMPPGSRLEMHHAMIAALEAIGADASLLAHHALAAQDGPRILRYAPAAGSEAARSGAHREAAAFFETAVRQITDDDPGRAALLEVWATELYLTDRLDAAIAARTEALELHRAVGDLVAVGAEHTAISYYHWYAADRFGAERHDEAAISVLTDVIAPRELGFAWANRAFLAAQHADTGEAFRCGAAAQRLADQVDDVVLHHTASIAIGVARLLEGDLEGRGVLLSAQHAGLRYKLDDLATTPMSNLVHLDVEQGRFAEAEDALRVALRISDERGAPICSMWQHGVKARLRLLQGHWREAEEDAQAVLAAGRLPLGRLWPHLVLGLLDARRDAPVANDHLDEMWRLAIQLDDPTKLAPAAAALAEQAWILNRVDRRLDQPEIARLLQSSFGTHEQVLGALREWLRRLDPRDREAERGTDEIEPVVVTGDDPYAEALRLWDVGSADALLAALPVLDGLGARAVAVRFRARLRSLGVAGVPRGPRPNTRANPAGLTSRQLDVLALVVDGLSNAEIADRLFISPKTTDHHVSAILTKLNVQSRGEAAALVRRLDS